MPEELPADVQRELALLEDRTPAPAVGLVTALARWESLIGEIGSYRGGIADEYLNDLGSRTHIHLWLSLAAKEGLDAALAWALPLVDASDERFMGVSQRDTNELIDLADRLQPEYWWYRRLPNDAQLIDHFTAIASG